MLDTTHTDVTVQVYVQFNFFERIQPGDTVPIYLKRNPNFKFPKEGDTPVIMIGPGTGVAPFRAYMQEREEHGFKGNTWLFFGDQHFTTDFLYQTEWQEWLKDGVLGKMDVAFSRDTGEKVYVQHRILEHSKEFNEWLQKVLHFTFVVMKNIWRKMYIKLSAMF